MVAEKLRLRAYRGFEQGPIRPPSEAGSLLIRITRNCPWNRCSFCPVYKGAEFSLRSVEDVLEDINRVHGYVQALRDAVDRRDRLLHEDVVALTGKASDRAAAGAAVQWARAGMQSIFLQDANSLVIKPERLIAILDHLRRCFPWVTRITSYARSHTIARIRPENLRQIALSGLNRIHIGMESGSDEVLARVKKGADKATHILAGRRVKEAGMELSEYLMPGLGGRELSNEHARESADALNQINPDFIRLRSLALPSHVELFREQQEGRFTSLTDVEMVQELVVFCQSLEGITSRLASDHILNLFEDLDGRYPEDKARLLALLQGFLELDPEEQMLYRVGRRLGLFRSLTDLADQPSRNQVRETCLRLGITPANVDRAVAELTRRFI
ncbi:MAG: radical SAM protein [Desulforhopalus sp.]|jgi:hypothetical protein|nr:radical SAM protein [Desulforhopalus sp.]